MEISRRQLVAVGMTGAAGAIVGTVATSEAPAAAAARLPGVHISVLVKGVSPEWAMAHPYQCTMTVYGPDNALNGMGWGGATDVKTKEDLINARLFNAVYSLTGAVEGDVVRLHGLILFAHDLVGMQGQPLSFEANLATGFVRLYADPLPENDKNPLLDSAWEGTGVVARI